MSYSDDLARGEIAYNSYHALDEEYAPFDSLSKEVQNRWAQAACDSSDAYERGPFDVAHWRKAVRDGHAKLREARRQKEVTNG